MNYDWMLVTLSQDHTTSAVQSVNAATIWGDSTRITSGTSCVSYGGYRSKRLKLFERGVWGDYNEINFV